MEVRMMEAVLVNNKSVSEYNCLYDCLQCFDAVGWVAGRASGL